MRQKIIGRLKTAPICAPDIRFKKARARNVLKKIINAALLYKSLTERYIHAIVPNNITNMSAVGLIKRALKTFSYVTLYWNV